jgi:proton-coupled amino acid transporter
MSQSEVEIPRANEFIYNFDKNTKLGTWETYFTLIKAFICTSIIYAPRAFVNGGWVFTSLTITLSAFLTYFSCLNLLDAAKKTGLNSYSDIGHAAYGGKGAFLSDLTLVTSQSGFCCAFVYYLNSNT